MDVTVGAVGGVDAALETALGGASLVVDELFGTGLDRPNRRLARRPGARAERGRGAVFAINLPSGLDSDTGDVLGVAVEAALTATFAGQKRGLWQEPGRGHAARSSASTSGCRGRIRATGSSSCPTRAAGFPAGRWRPTRAPPASVLVVAGSPGRTGAALLSGHGALRGGAGLVTIAARGAARDALDQKVVELMTASLPEDGEGARRAVLALAEKMDAAAVGPGLGLDDEGRALSVALARELPIPAVLDADALTAVAEAAPRSCGRRRGPGC